MKPGFVYILKCSEGSLYTGCAANLEQRVAKHNTGKASKYTRSRLPVTPVFYQEFPDIRDALSAERQIKKWSRSKKLALIAGEFALLHELSACQNDSHSDNKPERG
ncbi:MAG: GIY-YIG nuclease family protein [bacterium]|nr:GIY-YIG nuclease family protein [bacterium]